MEEINDEEELPSQMAPKLVRSKSVWYDNTVSLQPIDIIVESIDKFSENFKKYISDKLSQKHEISELSLIRKIELSIILNNPNSSHLIGAASLLCIISIIDEQLYLIETFGELSDIPLEIIIKLQQIREFVDSVEEDYFANEIVRECFEARIYELGRDGRKVVNDAYMVREFEKV